MALKRGSTEITEITNLQAHTAYKAIRLYLSFNELTLSRSPLTVAYWGKLDDSLLWKHPI